MRPFGVLKVVRFFLIALCSAFVVNGPLARGPLGYSLAHRG